MTLKSASCQIRSKKFGLTERMREALNFIDVFIEGHGYAPSYDDIANGMKLRSKSSVHRLVKALVQRGHIEYIPMANRSLRVIK